jgi:hypothetical protein
MWILFPFGLGILFWIIYSFSLLRVFIDYERVVFFTALMAILLAGVGLFGITKWLEIRLFARWVNSFLCVVIGVFMIMMPAYTARASWERLKLYNLKTQRFYSPAAPANRYLTEDDLKIFENKYHQRFLSLPWKGTVIGVATNNFPLCVKSGTISMNQNLYADFSEASCEEKMQVASGLNLDYIYSSDLNCPNFGRLTKSQEGLNLYRVK